MHPHVPRMGYTRSRMLRIALGIMIFVAAGMPARADYALGMIAYEQEDYAAAYENWKPLAE